jgi:hypothetical protein
VRSQVFEQVSGPGEFNFVTLVEWESADALELAATAIAQRQAELGYDRAKTSARLGIRFRHGELSAAAAAVTLITPIAAIDKRD